MQVSTNSNSILITTEQDEVVTIVMGAITLHIKHNDVGISIDSYPNTEAIDNVDSEPVEEIQMWFDDYTCLTEWDENNPDPPGWICTDPDNMQFARQINETTWEYRQLCDDVELISSQYLNEHDRFKDAWEVDLMWESRIINANDYTEQQQWEHVKSFYTSEEFLEFRLESKWQMICECIFENDLPNLPND